MTTVDWDDLDRLTRAAWGGEQGAQAETARAEVRRLLTEIAARYCPPASVRAYESDDTYLVVEGEVRPEALLQFVVGGEGRGWVQILDGNLIVFDCMGFDEMYWPKVERVIESLRAETEEDDDEEDEKDEDEEN
jgi:hypothetical protein